MNTRPTAEVLNTADEFTVAFTADDDTVTAQLLSLATILTPTTVGRLRDLREGDRYPTIDDVVECIGGRGKFDAARRVMSMEVPGDQRLDEPDTSGVRPLVFTNRQADKLASVVEPRECICCERYAVQGETLCAEHIAEELEDYAETRESDRVETSRMKGE